MYERLQCVARPREEKKREKNLVPVRFSQTRRGGRGHRGSWGHRPSTVSVNLVDPAPGSPLRRKGPAVTKRSKQLRTWKMLRQLRSLGYRIETPNPQQPTQAQ